MKRSRRDRKREELLGRINGQRRDLQTRLSRLQLLQANLTPLLQIGVSGVRRTWPWAAGGAGLVWLSSLWRRRKER